MQTIESSSMDAETWYYQSVSDDSRSKSAFVQMYQ